MGGSSGVAGAGGLGGVGGSAGASGAGGALGFPCTEEGIRDAIVAGGGPHFFACDGPTTVVIDTELLIDNDVILDGEGELTVEGEDIHPMIEVTAESTVVLRGFELANSFEFRSPDIVTLGTLTLTDVRLFTNWIDNDGTLTMADCSMATRFDWDVGAFISNDGTLVATNGDFSGVHIANFGAVSVDTTMFSGASTATRPYVLSGIYNNVEDGTVMLTNSTVSGSEISGIGNVGTMTIGNSTISGNGLSLGDGGGIDNRGTMTVTNSTVSGNTGRFGAGIFAISGTLVLRSTTVSGNAATSQGASIYNGSNGSMITVTNSLIDGDCVTMGLPFASSGHNIESPGDTCGFDQPSDQVDLGSQALELGPLTSNGGPTATHALGAGSVAIDHIPAGMCLDADGAPLLEDQRGEARPSGGSMCDVGSFEVQADP